MLQEHASDVYHMIVTLQSSTS